VKIYFPKLSIGSVQARKPTRSINPFSTKTVTVKVPVLKVPKLPFKFRSPFTKA
jgi:hypothetical protein